MLITLPQPTPTRGGWAKGKYVISSLSKLGSALHASTSPNTAEPTLSAGPSAIPPPVVWRSSSRPGQARVSSVNSVSLGNAIMNPEAEGSQPSFLFRDLKSFESLTGCVSPQSRRYR